MSAPDCVSGKIQDVCLGGALDLAHFLPILGQQSKGAELPCMHHQLGANSLVPPTTPASTPSPLGRWGEHSLPKIYGK